MNVRYCLVLLSIGLKQFSALETDDVKEICENQFCNIGYEFCETQKRVCRQCSDFKDFCWDNHRHIRECTSYCIGNVPLPGKKEPNTEQVPVIGLYISLSMLALFAIACVVLTYVVIRLCRQKTKKALNDDSRSATLTDASGEETHFLKNIPEDVVHIPVNGEGMMVHTGADSHRFVSPIHTATNLPVNIERTMVHPRADSHGFVSPIHTATNGCEDSTNIMISGKPLPPRD